MWSKDAPGARRGFGVPSSPHACEESPPGKVFAVRPFCYSEKLCKTSPLAVGTDARPTAVDWHDRGEPDLLIAHSGGPEAQGITLFRVTRRDDHGLPVYDAGERIPHFGPAEAVTPWPNGRDSRFDLITSANGSLWRFPNNGSATGPWFGEPTEHPLPAEIRELGVVTKLRVADVDQDGTPDLLAGILDDSAYFPGPVDGWGRCGIGLDTRGRNVAADERGRWLGEPLHGYIFWLRNCGTETVPDFVLGGPLLTNGRPLDLNAQPSPVNCDWNRDGVAELLVIDSMDRLCSLSASSPGFGLREFGRPVTLRACESSDEALALPAGASLALADPAGKKENDLVLGTRDGRLLALTCPRGTAGVPPVWQKPAPLMAESRVIHLGESPVPAAADWNGDGVLDLVVGTAAGAIHLIENHGSSAEPEFAPAVLATVDGRPLRIEAGPEGTILGPRDRGRGYLCPEVVDWDGDGRLDLIVNDYSGHLTLYQNLGTDREPDFAPGRPIMKGDVPFSSVWRVRPACVDWDGDGRPDLLALDHYGCLNLYQRDGDGLRPGRRLTDRLGRPIQLDGSHGASGRVSLCACDWDGDGDIDLFVGLSRHNAHVVQNLSGGAYPPDQPASILLLENVGDQKEPAYVPRIVKAEGQPVYLGRDGCAPHAAFWTGGRKPDLVVGNDAGLLYFIAADEWEV